MTHAGYVIAGYGVTFGVLGAYVAWMALKSRALERSSPSADVVPASPDQQG